jgi:AcrR family transcriptional regulator
LSGITEEKVKILNFAENKFITEGFYKISMDEIAKELRMSKKTIYKHFPSKDILVSSVSDDIFSQMNSDISFVIDSSENVVNKFCRILSLYMSKLMHISDKWYRDLRLHAPELWDKIEKMRSEKIYSLLNKLLKQGKKEKLIEDYPNELILAAFVSTVKAVVNPEFISKNKYSLRRTFLFTFEMLLNGILTIQGRELYVKTKRSLKLNLKNYLSQ